MTGKLKHPVSHGGASGGEEALQRAMIALNSGHPADAERIAADVLKTNRRNVMALQVLANALLMQNRIADAIAPLETAVRGNHDPQIETMLGIVLRQAGRIEDAPSWLKGAVKRRPPHVQAVYEFGCLLAFLNRDDAAVEALNRGLDVAPLIPQLSVQLGSCSSGANFMRGGQDCVRPRVSQCRGLPRGPVRPGQDASGGRR